MLDLTIILVIAASLSVILVVVGIALALSSPRAAVMGRLDKVTAAVGNTAGQPAAKEGIKEDFLWVLGKLGRLSLRRSSLQQTQDNLIKAGIMMRSEEYIGLAILTAVVAYTTVYLLSGTIIFGLLAAIFGIILPGIIVNSKKGKRSRAMTDQLPEALNIIASGLRAGFSFPQALSVLIKEIEGPLTDEFSRLLRENRLGKPMDDALNDMFGRIDNDDLELLVTALLIQRQVGGNLAEVLDGISHTIRERVRIKGEIRALTAEGRMSAIILILLPLVVATMMYMINTEYILTLFNEPVGILMVVGAVIMQVIGILFIRKIVAIDV